MLILGGASVALNKGVATISAAYNQNNGNSGALASLGGGPFYTSMEDSTLDGVSGIDAKAIVLAVEIEAYQQLLLGISAGNFYADNRANYHVREIDLYMTYEWNDALLIEAVYANIEDQNAADDTDQFRVISTYYFDGI